MSIHAVFGPLGSRKTLFSIVAAYAIRDHLPFNFKIMANFTLAGSKRIECFQDIMQAENAILLLDEAHIFMNSRNYNSKENKALTQFGLVTRKRNLEVFFILPRLGSLDVNIRDIADYFHYMQLQSAYVFHQIYQHDMITEEYVLSGSNMFNVEDFEPYYDTYDTREIPTNFMLGAKL